MDTSKVKNALQDLIIRLQDAEKGFAEIEKATSITPLKKWLSRYSQERHKMHKALEAQSKLLGGDADVNTSFLGDLHRMFIDIKINNVNYEDEYDAIVNEIERGATKLIDDYNDVLANVDLGEHLKMILSAQSGYIQAELGELKKLKKELNAEVA